MNYCKNVAEVKEVKIPTSTLEEILKHNPTVLYELGDTCVVEGCEAQAEFLVNGNWEICMCCFEQADPAATTSDAYRDRMAAALEE